MSKVQFDPQRAAGLLWRLGLDPADPGVADAYARLWNKLEDTYRGADLHLDIAKLMASPATGAPGSLASDSLKVAFALERQPVEPPMEDPGPGLLDENPTGLLKAHFSGRQELSADDQITTAGWRKMVDANTEIDEEDAAAVLLDHSSPDSFLQSLDDAIEFKRGVVAPNPTELLKQAFSQKGPTQ